MSYNVPPGYFEIIQKHTTPFGWLPPNKKPTLFHIDSQQNNLKLYISGGRIWNWIARFRYTFRIVYMGIIEESANHG
jgi:hypothetical protein